MSRKKNDVAKQIPKEVVDRAIEVYSRLGMVWQNVPYVLADEFNLTDGDKLWHNHALCAAANNDSNYQRKRKKRGFLSSAKQKALQEALVELNLPSIDLNALLEKAALKLVKTK